MESISTLKLTLNELDDGLPGISSTWGKFLCEASSYCFELKNHSQGVEMNIEGHLPNVSKVFWSNKITGQTRNAWNDTQELTEYGASGIAILLVLKLTEFTVIRRAVKGEGVDYWLGHKSDSLFIQDAARLEISGIIEGTASKIKTRLKQKQGQTYPTDGKFPAYIVVVEFSKPISHLIKK